MEYKQTVFISKKDIEKLMKAKAIKSLRQLAIIAGVDYTYLNKCYNGKLVMSEYTWDKIKICL
jgi:hypothetical protein